MTVPLQRLSASQAYRFAGEQVVFESVHDVGIDAEKWASITATGGSVSHDAAKSAHIVAVSSASGSRAVLRSHARPRAAAGRSRSCVIACNGVGVGNTNQVKRWGMFDDENGYFFQLSGEQLSVVRRSNVSGSVVDSAVNREQWMVGSSQNGGTPQDVTDTHVYEIREVWPNGDAIFLIDGAPMHQIDTDGAITGPACRTARLPVSVEIVNTAGAFADSWYVQGASVSVEGSLDGKVFDAEVVNAAVPTSLTPLFSVRVADVIGGKANLAELAARALSMTCSADCRVSLVLNGSLTGATWAGTLHADSVAMLDVAATAITGGRAVTRVGTGSFLRDDLREVLPALRIQGDGSTRDVLTVCAQAITGTVSARAVLSWKEIR